MSKNEVMQAEETNEMETAVEAQAAETKPSKPEKESRTVAKYSDEDLDRIINAKVAKLMEKQEKKINEAKKLAEMDAQQKAVAVEDVQKYGFDRAISMTDDLLLRELQKELRKQFFAQLAKGTGIAAGVGLQAHWRRHGARCLWSTLQNKLGTPEDGVISSPSMVIKELQRRLNQGRL